MKKIILVRHAKTEQLLDYNKSDFDRKLLPRGHKDSTLIADQLKNKGYLPDLYITSSAKRARQTAELFALILGHDTDNIKKEQFIYDGYTTSDMLSYVEKFDDNINTIIIFGHNPDIASFTINLINEDIWHFPTSCTTVIRFEVDSWKDVKAREGKIELYLYPKMLK